MDLKSAKKRYQEAYTSLIDEERFRHVIYDFIEHIVHERGNIDSIGVDVIEQGSGDTDCEDDDESDAEDIGGDLHGDFTLQDAEDLTERIVWAFRTSKGDVDYKTSSYA